MRRDEEYEAGGVTIQHEYRFGEIEEWNLFQEEKKKIQDKYPTKPWITSAVEGRGNYKNPYNEEWWKDWQAYKKEILDLILSPNGNFGKFLYEIRPERDRRPIDTWMRGKYNTDYYTHGKKKQNE